MVCRSKYWFKSAIIFILVVGVVYKSGAEEIYVIAGKDVPTISEKELKNLFLGFRSELPNGKTPALFIVKEMREVFTARFLGTSYSEFKTHWVLKTLSGTGVVPIELSLSEVIERVKANPVGVGVVPEVSGLEDVKILLKIK